MGYRDTVSSVGILRDKTLPLTDTADHVCFFRHALALDERRVKFLPEYVCGGVFHKGPQTEEEQQAEKDGCPTALKHTTKVADPDVAQTTSQLRPHVKEVWFPGTHSDM